MLRNAPLFGQPLVATLPFLTGLSLVLFLAGSTCAQPNLVLFGAENFPAGTTKPTSDSPNDDPDVVTHDFNFSNDPTRYLDLLELERDLNEDFNLFAVFQTVLAKTGSVEDSPFGVLALRSFEKFAEEPGPNPATLLVQAVANADPFFAYQVTLVNDTAEPLSAVLDFTQGTLPIAIDVPLQFETALLGEVLDTDGDGSAAVDSVFASYRRSLSDTTNPTEDNTVTSEIVLDSLQDLQPGVPQSDVTEASNLFVSSFEVDFFDSLGVPVEDRGTIAMSASVSIDGLSPGDSFTFQIAHSIGSADGSIPLVPAEGVAIALERGIFDVVPEPSSFSMLVGVVAIAAGCRRCFG